MADRASILSALESRLKPLPYVIAMWQGGAAAFDRVDQWSDVDVQFGVEDDAVEQTFAEVERALSSLEPHSSTPLTRRYRAPMPTWHGHDQGVFCIDNTSPFLFVDLVVMKRSADNRFLEREIHGDIVVHFDKEEWLTQPPFDNDAHQKQMLERLHEVHARFRLLQVLIDKEVARGNSIEAHTFYSNCTLRPYVELLRMRYSPTRFGFHTRYIHYELPAEEVARVERFTYVRDMEQLVACQREIQTLFYPLYEELLQELQNS